MRAKDDAGEKPTPRVAFNRLRKEVAARLEEGHTRRAIYREFDDRLGMSYAMFCRYVISLERTQAVEVIRPARGRLKPTPDIGTASPAEVPSPPASPPPARDTSNAERDGPSGAPAGKPIPGKVVFKLKKQKPGDRERMFRRAEPDKPDE